MSFGVFELQLLHHMEKDSSPAEHPPFPTLGQLSPEQLSALLQSPQIDLVKYPPNLISWANTISSYYNQHILQLQEAKLACLQKLLTTPSHNLAIPISPSDLSSTIANNIELINSNLPSPTPQKDEALNHYLHHLITQCRPYSLTTPTQTHLQHFLPSLINFPSTTALQLQTLTLPLAIQLPIHFPNLKSLTIMSQQFTFERSARDLPTTRHQNALMQINKNKRLERIVIKGWNEKDDHFIASLADMTSLRELLVPFESKEEMFMKVFLSNRSLEGFNITFEEEPLSLLQFMYKSNPGLSHLEITEEILIEPAYFNTLCQFKNLQHLVINQPQRTTSRHQGENFSTKDIAILLQNLPNITKLNIKSLGQIPLFLRKLEEHLPGLEELHLNYQKNDRRREKRKCKYFPKLPNLKKLHINCSGFTEGVVEQWIDSKFKLKALILKNIDYLEGDETSSEEGEEIQGEYFLVSQQRHSRRGDRERRRSRNRRRSPPSSRTVSSRSRSNSRPRPLLQNTRRVAHHIPRANRFNPPNALETDTFLLFLTTQPSLQILKLGTQNPTTSPLLMSISSLFPLLRTLELKNLKIKPAGLLYLSKLRNLQHFYFQIYGEDREEGNTRWSDSYLWIFLRILRNNFGLKLYENYFVVDYAMNRVRGMYREGKGKKVRNMRVMGRAMRCDSNELGNMATVREKHLE